MAAHKSFLEDFYTETMTEMAENFFARRREMEARLEGFGRLADEVRSLAVKTLRRWHTFFSLLGDEEAALRFLRSLGLEPDALPTLGAASGDPWRFHPPFALTFAGRYRKSVRYVYQAVRQASQDYLDGTYGQDPRNPAKKILLPNLAGLKDLAERINKEVESVNTGQTMSTVLAYAKSMDPVAAEKDAIIGGLAGEDAQRIDKDMAFTPVDFPALGLPELPRLPALEEVQDALDDLADAVRQADEERSRSALNYVSAG